MRASGLMQIQVSKNKLLSRGIDLEILNCLGNGYILAGGALRKVFDHSEIIKDYDIFYVGKGVPEIQNFISPRFTVTKETNALAEARSKHMTAKVQLIRHTYESAQELLETFDFYNCMLALERTRHSYLLTCSPYGIRKIRQRKLVLRKVTDHQTTLFRIHKYLMKGYKLDWCTFQEHYMVDAWKDVPFFSGIYDEESV